MLIVRRSRTERRCFDPGPRPDGGLEENWSGGPTVRIGGTLNIGFNIGLVGVEVDLWGGSIRAYLQCSCRNAEERSKQEVRVRRVQHRDVASKFKRV